MDFNVTTIKLSNIGEKIDQYHANLPNKPRPHLGASVIGHYCERFIWLNFRWAIQEKFEGRILRLFRRGQNEELTIYKDLAAVGINVSMAQARITINNHFGGSIDGVAENVPEAPKTPHLLECKTHGEKSFIDLKAKGVAISKPQHFDQMQIYCHGMGLNRALYCAINKNTDEYYFERINYDKDHALKVIDKANRIVNAETIPPPIHHDATWYQCKMCAAHGFCHENKPIEHKNCRTCDNALVTDKGWACIKWQAEIPTDAQYLGCEYWTGFIKR